MSATPSPFQLPAEALSYWTDAWQRSILFMDVMRKRAEQYVDHAAQTVPHVLDYQAELVCDGRDLPRPVNYCLVRIVPPEGITIDPVKRPFVVVDPRAGHGPGIGGFKADSEVGVALKAGHECYFIGFLPEPMEGQTIEDITRAEAIFLETVIARHPQTEGKPCVIGNCQAGWAIMMLASLRPELFGPIIIAGSPLSYWAGVRGQYPMRYSGGLLGGSWLTALTSDLGHGKFDGASLVQNFENQNPANTLWTKQYNLYSKIDTEAPRYLGFERYWGGYVMLNSQEMQFIVDELFVGNKLAAGLIRASDGTTLDLRNIRSPILVFCSKGDNITPPQQALDWILDLYDSVDDIRAHGQTIVYAVHEKIGHLGIFVSTSVAKKEHDEFASNIDMIDVLPPGLYEAVLTPKSNDVENPDLVSGNWIMRCEARTLEDIRALGGNDLEDERRFEAAARLSEINLALYRMYLQPWVRAMSSRRTAEAMRTLHPLRLKYQLFGHISPLNTWIVEAASRVRGERQPVASDNIFLQLQERASQQIIEALDTWRHTVEKTSENIFRTVYGQPWLQKVLGIDSTSDRSPRRAAKDLLHAQLVAARQSELRTKIPQGGLREAMTRAVLFVGMGRDAVDERGFEALQRLRRSQLEVERPPLPDFKALVREQFYMLLLDEEATLSAIPYMLPDSIEERRKAFEELSEIAGALGKLSDADTKRIERIARLFRLGEESKVVMAA